MAVEGESSNGRRFFRASADNIGSLTYSKNEALYYPQIMRFLYPAQKTDEMFVQLPCSSSLGIGFRYGASVPAVSAAIQLRQTLAGNPIMIVIQPVGVIAGRATAAFKVGLRLAVGCEILAVLIAGARQASPPLVGEVLEVPDSAGGAFGCWLTTGTLNVPQVPHRPAPLFLACCSAAKEEILVFHIGWIGAHLCVAALDQLLIEHALPVTGCTSQT